mmetsp:Transcript_63249/g.137583  ORF Transcript_63249/g.137583 Transcript_63249/m.137583 type:complete len:203 (+) Transcript_63249:60-668(+)
MWLLRLPLKRLPKGIHLNVTDNGTATGATEGKSLSPPAARLLLTTPSVATVVPGLLSSVACTPRRFPLFLLLLASTALVPCRLLAGTAATGRLSPMVAVVIAVAVFFFAATAARRLRSPNGLLPVTAVGPCYSGVFAPWLLFPGPLLAPPSRAVTISILFSLATTVRVTVTVTDTHTVTVTALSLTSILVTVSASGNAASSH